MPARELTPELAEALGETAGTIAAFVAKSLNRSFPHLDLEELTATFTREPVIRMITVRYLAGVDGGRTPAEAAGDVGAELIHTWAASRLAARACLDQPGAGVAPEGF